MTTVEMKFRYAGEPGERVAFALASARDVYGMRRVEFLRGEHTLLVEYDATRLNAATVEQLVRRTGLVVVERLEMIPPPAVAEEKPAA